MKHYAMDQKPNFKDGEVVLVDMFMLGSDAGILSGKVVGKSSIHAIDMWMIQFDTCFPTYPYKVLNVPHTAIIMNIDYEK